MEADELKEKRILENFVRPFLDCCVFLVGLGVLALFLSFKANAPNQSKLVIVTGIAFFFLLAMLLSRAMNDKVIKHIEHKLAEPLGKLISDYMEGGGGQHLREELSDLQTQTIPTLVRQRAFLVRRLFANERLPSADVRDVQTKLLEEISGIEKILLDLEKQLSLQLGAAIGVAAGQADGLETVGKIRVQIAEQNARLLEAYREL